VVAGQRSDIPKRDAEDPHGAAGLA
jgi:hypothetical protein